MQNNSNNNQRKSNQFLSEIISPIFGHDYENRVIVAKNQQNRNNKNIEEISYLEKQIEEALEAQVQIFKLKEYQENLKTDTNVLEQYYKQKENEKLHSTLPSNYLNFRDDLEKKSDLSIISEFNFDDESNFISTNSNNTISEIIDEIFDNN